MNPLTEKKKAILNCASEIIQKHGLSSLVMDDVALHCGISKKTIYEIFAGKDILIQELTIAFLQEEKALWENELQKLSTPEDKVHYVFDFLFRSLELLSFENLALMKKKHAYSFSLLEGFYEQISEKLTEFIVTGQKDRLYDPGIKAEILTQHIIQQFIHLQKRYRNLIAEDLYKTWKEQLEMFWNKILSNNDKK